jgi:carbohydrate-binding DOMON domain-containing protein
MHFYKPKVLIGGGVWKSMAPKAFNSIIAEVPAKKIGEVMVYKSNRIDLKYYSK